MTNSPSVRGSIPDRMPPPPPAQSRAAPAQVSSAADDAVARGFGYEVVKMEDVQGAAAAASAAPRSSQPSRWQWACSVATAPARHAAQILRTALQTPNVPLPKKCAEVDPLTYEGMQLKNIAQGKFLTNTAMNYYWECVCTDWDELPHEGRVRPKPAVVPIQNVTSLTFPENLEQLTARHDTVLIPVPLAKGGPLTWAHMTALVISKERRADGRMHLVIDYFDPQGAYQDQRTLSGGKITLGAFVQSIRERLPEASFSYRAYPIQNDKNSCGVLATAYLRLRARGYDHFPACLELSGRPVDELRHEMLLDIGNCPSRQGPPDLGESSSGGAAAAAAPPGSDQWELLD